MDLGLKSKMCKCQDVPASDTARYKIRYNIENSHICDLDFDLYFDWVVDCQHKWMDKHYPQNKADYVKKTDYKRPIPVNIDNIIGQPIFPGSITIVTGESGTGKTTFLLQALGEHAFYRRVGYVSGEQNIGFLNQICERCGVLDVDIGNITDVDEICELMSEYKLLVVDSFPCIQFNENKYGKMSKLAGEQFMLNKLAQSAQKTNCALFIILHSTKAGQYKGSTFFKHTVDNMITLKKSTNGFVEINLEKSRAAPPNIIYLRMSDGGFDNVRTYLDLSKPIHFPLYRHFSNDAIVKMWSYGKDFNYTIDKSTAINVLLTKPTTSLIYKIAKKSLQYYYKKYPNEQKDYRIAKTI